MTAHKQNAVYTTDQYYISRNSVRYTVYTIQIIIQSHLEQKRSHNHNRANNFQRLPITHLVIFIILSSYLLPARLPAPVPGRVTSRFTALVCSLVLVAVVTPGFETGGRLLAATAAVGLMKPGTPRLGCLLEPFVKLPTALESGRAE
jgi:hypothetical protein